MPEQTQIDLAEYRKQVALQLGDLNERIAMTNTINAKLRKENDALKAESAKFKVAEDTAKTESE